MDQTGRPTWTRSTKRPQGEIYSLGQFILLKHCWTSGGRHRTSRQIETPWKPSRSGSRRLRSLEKKHKDMFSLDEHGNPRLEAFRPRASSKEAVHMAPMAFPQQDTCLSSLAARSRAVSRDGIPFLCLIPSRVYGAGRRHSRNQMAKSSHDGASR